MAVEYPIDFPTTFGVSNYSIGLDHAVAGGVSPFTFQEQMQVHQGRAWDITFSMQLLTRDQAEEYNAFILKLGGREGTFTMSIPASELQRGNAEGFNSIVTEGGDNIATESGDTLGDLMAMRVDGADQTGRVLNVQGLPISATNVFKVGDFIQIETKLYKVLDNIDSNASGGASLTIAPPIAIAHADNTDVKYNNAKGVFRAKNNMSPVNITPPFMQTINFSAREVV